MSYCPSSGYHNQPCSQSQKMSIGIAVDLVEEPRSRSTKDAEVSVKPAERESSDPEHQGLNVKQDFRSFGTRNARADYVQAVIRSGQLTANPLIKDNHHIDKRASTSSMIGFREKKTRSSHLFLNQAVLQPVVGEKIETSRAVSRQEGKKDVATERYGEFPPGDKQEVCMSVKGMPQELSDEMENRSKKTLRMKLQEILGTIPSANKKYEDSTMGEVVAYEVIQVQTDKRDARFKHRQSSDTIETDSERAEETIRRPVTRSLARKRAPAKTSPTTLKIESLSRDKEEYQGSHVFPFKEKSVPSKSCEENLRCLRPEKFDNVKQSCGIKPVDVIDHVADVVNIQRVITRDKKLQPREELSLEGGMMSPQHGCLHENLEPEAATLNKIFNCSPAVREKDQPPKAECPISPEVSNHHKSLSSQSPVHHDDDLSSPLFNMTKTFQNSPMSFLPLINEKKHHVQGIIQAEGGNAACLYKYTPTTEDDTGSSDGAATPEETYATTPESSTAEKAKDGLFSPKRRELDSSGGVFSAKQEDVYTSPEPGVIEKPILFRAKRHCSDGVDHSNSSPTMQSPKAGANTDDELMEPLEESPEDDCARVVSLLGLALKRVRNKMMSVTNKRCSDILTSAAEEIHMQLCNVESQIQTDLGKLTSLNKSKRKHLETRLQEQQEHLKIIYEKFKKEIHQYIQDCKDAAEMLEADHVELKGAIERQKTLHRKFLLQAEATVETQLNDAQRQIASVHKLRRQKMQKLKSAIAECLKDGISN